MNHPRGAGCQPAPRRIRTFPERGSSTMKRILPFVALLWLAAGPAARAQDKVYTKADPNKPVQGSIEDESPAGIKIKEKGGVQAIPATEILDIVYDVRGAVTVGYTPAVAKEKELDSPATKEEDRRKILADAVKRYEEVIPKLRA